MSLVDCLMLEIRQCRTRVLINLELLAVGRLGIRYVSLTGSHLGCTDDVSGLCRYFS